MLSKRYEDCEGHQKKDLVSNLYAKQTFSDGLGCVFYFIDKVGGQQELYHRTVVVVGDKSVLRYKRHQDSPDEQRSMSTWGYTRTNGPHTWAVSYPDAAGNGQSPIDIVTDDVICDSDITATPLTITYRNEESFEAINTGESFKVNIAEYSEIQGGPLKNRYRLEQFHLHWGSCDRQGSEHTVDGKMYAAELHLVHWNCTKYSSFAEAASKHDGLSVFGIMIEVGCEHGEFKDMCDTMKSVMAGGQQCKVLKSFNPSSLLPENTKDFWTYHGSLTTPPCYESVQWIVFKEPVQYSANQLCSLRSLHNAELDGTCIADNYRPPMPLGDRKVRSSFSNMINNNSNV